MTEAHRIGLIAWAEFIRLLTLQPSSQVELMEATGLSRSTTVDYLKALRSRRVVRIGGWGPDPFGRMQVPLFCMCHPRNSKDAPKVPRRTPAKKAKDYRERKARYEQGKHLQFPACTP